MSWHILSWQKTRERNLATNLDILPQQVFTVVAILDVNLRLMYEVFSKNYIYVHFINLTFRLWNIPIRNLLGTSSR